MSGKVWEVRWSHGRLMAPEGSVLPLVWGDFADMAVAHAAIDAWAEEAGIPTRLPRVGDFDLWWILRIKLVHTHLPGWLPVLRALRPLRGEFALLRLHAPPAPWWPGLLAAAFPEAQIEVVAKAPPASTQRRRQLAARLLRACTTLIRLRRVRPKRPGRPRVLVISRARSWNGKTDIEVGPVIAALETRGVDVIVLDQTHEGLIADLAGWRTRPRTHLFGDYFFLRYFLRHRTAQPALPAGWKAHFTGLPNLVVGDFTLAAVFHEQLQRDAADFYRGLSTYVDQVPPLLRRLGVDAVLTTDETGGELGPVMGTVTAGVPVVALQHGCIHPDHMAYQFPSGADARTIPLCSKTCVYGAHYAALLVERSIYPQEAVVITGQPQGDTRPAALRPWGHRSDAAEALRREILPPGCDTLLLLSSQELLVDYLQAMLLPALASAAPRHYLVIRPHPREWDSAGWDRAIAAQGLTGRVQVRRGEALDPWLDACDIHIAATSTTLAEATLFGRPNILLGAKSLGDWMDCLAPGVAVDLADFEGLDAAVAYWLEADAEQRAAFEARRSAYLRAHFHEADGHAADRVASVVMDALGPQAP